MNDRGVISSNLLSPLSKFTNLENTSQFELVKASISNRSNDLLVHNTKSVSLFDNLLTIRDPGKTFELKGDLLKMITDDNFIVDLANLLDKKLFFDFAKEIYFEEKATGKKSTQDRTLIKIA